MFSVVGFPWFRRSAFWGVPVLTLVAAGWSAGESGAVTFNQHIRPILSDRCFQCHGRDAAKRKADLRLDVPEGAFAVNEHGRQAIKPGDVAQSELWRRVTAIDPDEVMPPPETHKSVTSAERSLIRKWIEQGAPYQKPWSFEPPGKSAPPELPISAGIGRTPIDAFLQTRLEKEGLAPSPEADRPTLIRRACIALTGLPPTLDELDIALSDPAVEWYERLVDRLLASPHYGEQMARHWLDVARYGDTHGLHLDNERSMWPYRDWVVNAFNRNLPFDQFTVEQLAGDLLPNATQDQLIATGFSRCNVTTGEGGSIDAEYLFRYAVDRTATMMQTWMGLTGRCAVCHDHKFDPISRQGVLFALFLFLQRRRPGDGRQRAADRADGPAPHRRARPAARRHRRRRRRRRKTDRRNAGVGRLRRSRGHATGAASPGRRIGLGRGRCPARRETAPARRPRWVTAAKGANVFSGKRALKRSGAGAGAGLLRRAARRRSTVPAEATLFAHVFLDPNDPPKAIMLQFHKGGWKHRAVWGDTRRSRSAAPNTPAKANMGPLPKAGEWVRLEVPAAKVGLKAGDQVTGLAFTQFGGTVYWDKSGVVGAVDPAGDPSLSLAAWMRRNDGKPSGDLPGELQRTAQEGRRRTARPRSRNACATITWPMSAPRPRRRSRR